jgi:hypothetical protein
VECSLAEEDKIISNLRENEGIDPQAPTTSWPAKKPPVASSEKHDVSIERDLKQLITRAYLSANLAVENSAGSAKAQIKSILAQSLPLIEESAQLGVRPKQVAHFNCGTRLSR